MRVASIKGMSKSEISRRRLKVHVSDSDTPEDDKLMEDARQEEDAPARCEEEDANMSEGEGRATCGDTSFNSEDDNGEEEGKPNTNKESEEELEPDANGQEVINQELEPNTKNDQELTDKESEYSAKNEEEAENTEDQESPEEEE